jgi:hypothetical protein
VPSGAVDFSISTLLVDFSQLFPRRLLAGGGIVDFAEGTIVVPFAAMQNPNPKSVPQIIFVQRGLTISGHFF